MTFKVGDIVELKSGGPPMTVTQVDTNLVGHTVIGCQWFFGRMETAEFIPDALIQSRPRKFDELKGAFAMSETGEPAKEKPSAEA